ncbi:bone morphogenetic protein 2-like [Tubulanus polymorphus]|uniref:bone morphogenetic protein 2-like n=1 Tax=Tubulanus polymorphus TaxID=672921 RepID=UPI003DA2E1A5
MVAKPITSGGLTAEKPYFSRRVRRAHQGMASVARVFRSDISEKEKIVYTKLRKRKIDFPIGDRVFSLSKITGAVVEIYKRAPSNWNWKKIADTHKIHTARVSIHQVLDRKAGKTKLLDSRLVAVNETGWFSFHVTPAVRDWTRDTRTNKGLELRIESARPGKWAAKIAKLVRFVPQNKSSHSDNRPNLVIFFKPKSTHIRD